MRLDGHQLNRTLLARQHLLERTAATPAAMAGHLLGLQAQESLPPYLSLAARLEAFDPGDVTAGLEDASLVRLSTVRGTLHLHPAAQARQLRPWLQPSLERQLARRTPVPYAEVWAATAEILADGPVDQRVLAEQLAERLGAKGADLWVVARTTMPLVQLPPRGTWRGSGGIVLDHLERWTGAPLEPVPVEDLVRAWLRAWGPATPADLTVWSGVTGLRPVLLGLPDLVRHEDDTGTTLFDVADGVLTDADVPAPVRLLGTYDDLWLSHAGRDRVTTPESRARWSGANGAVASTVFVDGWLAGLWRVVDGRVAVLELFRELTASERAQLDDEVARVDALLAT